MVFRSLKKKDPFKPKRGSEAKRAKRPYTTCQLCHCPVNCSEMQSCCPVDSDLNEAEYDEPCATTTYRGKTVPVPPLLLRRHRLISSLFPWIFDNLRVRLHMEEEHEDTTHDPRDISFTLYSAWDELFDLCFPNVIPVTGSHFIWTALRWDDESPRNRRAHFATTAGTWFSLTP